MEYTRLGSSARTISRIALGTMGFGDGTQAAITQGAGRIRVGARFYDVRFEAAGDENEAAISGVLDYM